MNTISGWQVFSPIPFSEYHTDLVFNSQPKELEIDKTIGHFDSKDFSHIAFHAHDYTSGNVVFTSLRIV